MGCSNNEKVEVSLNEDLDTAKRLGMTIPKLSSVGAKCYLFGNTGPVQEENEELKYVVIYQPDHGEGLPEALSQLAKTNPPEPLNQIVEDFEGPKDEPFERRALGERIGSRMCCKCNRNVKVVLAHKTDDGYSWEILEGTRYVKAIGGKKREGKCRKIASLIMSTSPDILKDCDDPPVVE